MVSKDDAKAALLEHLIAGVTAMANRISLHDIRDGWPAGAYAKTDEPVWSISLPSGESRVGYDQLVVISKITGRIVFDGPWGE